MKIEIEDGCIILESENCAEYWQLSNLSHNVYPKSKDYEGYKMKLEYKLDKCQD